MYVKTPTKAREEFYDLLKFVNHHSEPVVISSNNNEDNAVIMSLKEWESIKETLYIHCIVCYLGTDDRKLVFGKETNFFFVITATKLY